MGNGEESFFKKELFSQNDGLIAGWAGSEMEWNKQMGEKLEF